MGKKMKESSRAAFGEKLVELGGCNKDIVVLEADLGKSTYSQKFGKEYPDRYFQMGIAEANMLGVGSGLALVGKIVYVCSFACFITGRYDTIRMSVAYQNANVRIIGTHSGVAIGADGNSQQGLEDIGLMRGLPNMGVISPADGLETQAALDYSVKHKGPLYMRLTRQVLEPVHDVAYEFRYGKGEVLRDGGDVTLIATGGVVYNTLKAAEGLSKRGIKAKVLNMATIKPIDKELVISSAKQTGGIVTVEDHNEIGGLGSAVMEVVSSEYPVLVKRISIGDRFGESGSPNDLYKKFGLDIKSIEEKVVTFLRGGNKEVA